MLPGPFRLRLRGDFKRVYQRGHSVAVACLVLYWRKKGARQSRIGFSVSKKLGKATKRNLVKRRCRAAARQLLPQIPVGYDLIFVARQAAAGADYSRLSQEMAKALALMSKKIAKGGP